MSAVMSLPTAGVPVFVPDTEALDLQNQASCIFRAPTGRCSTFLCTCPFLGDVDRCNSAQKVEPIPRVLRQGTAQALPHDPDALVCLRSMRAKWAALELLQTLPDCVARAVAEYPEHLPALSTPALSAMVKTLVLECHRREDDPFVPAAFKAMGHLVAE